MKKGLMCIALLASPLLPGPHWAAATAPGPSPQAPRQASGPSDEVIWQRLRSHLNAGRLQEARSLCLEALEKRPDSVRFLRTLTAIELKSGHCAEGLEAIGRALRRAPHSPDVLYESALVSLQCGRTGEGIHTLRLLLLMNPQEPRVLYQLGKALLQTPDLAEALEHLQQHAGLRPQDPAGLRALAYGQILLTRFEEAQETIHRARAIEPDSWETDYYQGALDLEREAFDSAEQYFRSALQGRPEHGPSHLGLGKVLLRRGSYQAAVESLLEAERLLPQRADINFQLSRAYSRLGRDEEARRQIELFRDKRSSEDEALRGRQEHSADSQQPPPRRP